MACNELAKTPSVLAEYVAHVSDASWAVFVSFISVYHVIFVIVDEVFLTFDSV